jgi:hypothetical protein
MTALTVRVRGIGATVSIVESNNPTFEHVQPENADRVGVFSKEIRNREFLVLLWKVVKLNYLC